MARSPFENGVLRGSALDTGMLSSGSLRTARVPLVTAKGTKAMVPAGWPAAASPRQVPVSDAVLGARANRPSLAWSPSLDFLSRDPCARPPSRPPSKGTLLDGSPLRDIAEIWSFPLAAMSRSDAPFCPPPWWRGGWWRAQGRIGPDGRSSRDGTGCPFTAVPSTPPAAGTPDRRRRAGAPPRGVLSLVSFSGQAEKETRAVLSVRSGSSVVLGRGTSEQKASNRGNEQPSHRSPRYFSTAENIPRRIFASTLSGSARAMSRRSRRIR